MANCEELAGHAAETKVVMKRKRNPRDLLVILFLCTECLFATYVVAKILGPQLAENAFHRVPNILGT